MGLGADRPAVAQQEKCGLLATSIRILAGPRSRGAAEAGAAMEHGYTGAYRGSSGDVPPRVEGEECGAVVVEDLPSRDGKRENAVENDRAEVWKLPLLL